ncbi:MAG: signal recognition particle-docking protein FtsY [Bacteroidota bacterium]|nr:signal recognition particle-docking protein FtsY [Bacteroidota bacterium]
MGVFDFLKRKKAGESDELAKSELISTEDIDSLDAGLQKTKAGFFDKIGRAIAGKSTVDEEFLDDLEEILIGSDVGVPTTIKIINRLEKRVAKDKYLNVNELNAILQDEVTEMLTERGQGQAVNFNMPKKDEPYVIMVVGVNGVGKTTTIGKLAHQFTKQGNSVILGAADTFRAAAVDQLTIWSQRAQVPIVSRGMNADPAAVAYDTTISAMSKNVDIAIIDTAGRLHNKVGLMNELSKIKNSINKALPGAPHEVLLVLDASTGQNALEQAKQFTAATEVNAIALTKLDGTAKGGVVLAIIDQFSIPVKYIGLGEKIEDLRPFDKLSFIKTLFK